VLRVFVRTWLVLGLCLPVISAARADQRADEERFEQSLHWRQGKVELANGIVTLDVTPAWHFLDTADAQRVLTQAWGNPPSSDRPLGMLFPAGETPFTPDGWAVIVRYAQEGHVLDDDAARIDYAELLRDMQQATRDHNSERVKDSYAPIELIGGAEHPHYDATHHHLYWARELRFGDAPEREVNYDIRVLGRRGVLEMSAIARLAQVETVRAGMQQVLPLVTFNEGHRYAEFDSSADQVAAYGVGGLVAGGLLAKAGFFKVLLAGLVAAKKGIALGVIAVGSGVARWWRGRVPTA
jgi:uncharacterized membrane-anchored protein